LSSRRHNTGPARRPHVAKDAGMLPASRRHADALPSNGPQNTVSKSATKHLPPDPCNVRRQTSGYGLYGLLNGVWLSLPEKTTISDIKRPVKVMFRVIELGFKVRVRIITVRVRDIGTD